MSTAKGISLVLYIWLAAPGLAFASLSQGQLQEAMLTQGQANGRYWEQLDKYSKMTFLLGVLDGIGLLKGEIDRQDGKPSEHAHTLRATKRLAVEGADLSDIIAEIDRVFGDRSNIRIPVAYVYSFAAKKMSGSEPRVLESYLAELRRKFNK